MEAIIFLGLLALTWLFVEGAESIHFFKMQLNIANESKPKGIITRIIRELVTCCLCSGFWIGLAYYWYYGYNDVILIACLVSVGSEIFARLIGLIFSKI